jgi:ClpP class serine protease
MGDVLNIIFILFLLNGFLPLLMRSVLAMRRTQAIRAFERARGTRVITMLHRQETMSFLGIPIARYIDIEDSEQVLRAIRLTPPEMPIDIVLHTPGGLVLAAEQIASALKRHKGDVTVFVPHYAMSGGTLIALAADRIVMDENAVLGPVDPQLGGPQGAYPAASIVAALEQPNPNRDDQTLITGDVARKALRQVRDSVLRLLREHYDEKEAERIADELASGKWTHDYPIQMEGAKELGLRVGDDVPKAIYELMELYPQAGQRRPGVEFIPLPYGPPPRTPLPPRGDRASLD